MRRWIWIVGAFVLLGGIALLLLAQRPRTPRSSSASADMGPAPAAPATPPTASQAPSRAQPSIPSPSPKSTEPTPHLDASALASPQATVQTQISLLQSGDLEQMRETLLPSAQSQLSPEAFKACQVRVRQVKVEPDWEVAETSVEGGHRVTRVSMFGKSMTGFHEIDGCWLADALWCLPMGLP